MSIFLSCWIRTQSNRMFHKREISIDSETGTAPSTLREQKPVQKKCSLKFKFKPDLLPSFIEILYMRWEGGNIFANPPAKWVSPLNIVEYLKVMRPCSVILYLFALKAITLNLVGKSYQQTGWMSATMEAECNPGTLSLPCSFNVKKCSCFSDPIKILG